jgi:hypothetical protein
MDLIIQVDQIRRLFRVVTGKPAHTPAASQQQKWEQ